MLSAQQLVIAVIGILLGRLTLPFLRRIVRWRTDLQRRDQLMAETGGVPFPTAEKSLHCWVRDRVMWLLTIPWNSDHRILEVKLLSEDDFADQPAAMNDMFKVTFEPSEEPMAYNTWRSDALQLLPPNIAPECRSTTPGAAALQPWIAAYSHPIQGMRAEFARNWYVEIAQLATTGLAQALSMSRENFSIFENFGGFAGTASLRHASWFRRQSPGAIRAVAEEFVDQISHRDPESEIGTLLRFAQEELVPDRAIVCKMVLLYEHGDHPQVVQAAESWRNHLAFETRMACALAEKNVEKVISLLDDPHVNSPHQVTIWWPWATLFLYDRAPELSEVWAEKLGQRLIDATAILPLLMKPPESWDDRYLRVVARHTVNLMGWWLKWLPDNKLHVMLPPLLKEYAYPGCPSVPERLVTALESSTDEEVLAVVPLVLSYVVPAHGIVSEVNPIWARLTALAERIGPPDPLPTQSLCVASPEDRSHTQSASRSTPVAQSLCVASPEDRPRTTVGR